MKQLMHFTAKWCTPCKAMEPIIEDFRRRHPDVIYTKVDIDDDMQTAVDFAVMGVPTFISIIDENLFERKSGKATIFQLEALFNTL